MSGTVREEDRANETVGGAGAIGRRQYYRCVR